MEKEKMEELLVDYIDGKLSEQQAKEVEVELSKNEEAYQLYEQLREVVQLMDRSPKLEPSVESKAKLQMMLKEEIGTTRSKTIYFTPMVYRIAAGFALIMIGIGVGYWLDKNQQHENEIAALRKEMEATKMAMMSMLDNQQSASQRVMGATVAYNMEAADDEIVNALVKALNEDPNINVRIAALEALGKFHHQKHVRKALIASLAKQTDPMVQIELIRLMVMMKEKEAVKEMKRIITDDKSLPAVKDEAHTGILRLS